MHTEQHRHSHHHGCAESGHGPEVFYGYCHKSGRMRMMNYGDYMSNMQTAYSNLYQSPASGFQPMIDAWTQMLGGVAAQQAPSFAGDPQGHHHHHHHDDCHCHDHQHEECGCHCCIRCADLVEYVRCGEVRSLPITFDNDTRRERDVRLELGSFATESGSPVGWEGALSESEFKLPPCGSKTVSLRLHIDCNSFSQQVPGTTEGQRSQTVDSCKVVYTTLRAEGCMIRPLVIAIAVLPAHCGAYHSECGCNCCCN